MLADEAAAVTESPLAAAPERIRVVEYTDPYSIWCWGCEPAIRRFEVVYPDAVEIDVRMGGLFEDFAPMREWWARMSGGRWKDSVLAFMHAVADQHRMPMDPERMLGAMDDFRSTWPACVAVKAAELQGFPLGRRFLRRAREAALVDGRPVHRREVQIALASEVGLNGTRFATALEDGSADRAFEDDLDLCRSRGVKGFPTFEVIRGLVSLRIEGWQPWEVFDRALLDLDPDLRPRRLERSAPEVRGVLERYGRCATREVAAVFGVTDDDAEILLEDLEGTSVVRRREAAGGVFWELASETA